MATDIENSEVTGRDSRLALEQYTIQLDNDQYVLSREVLEKNVDLQTVRKRNWSHPALKFVSFSQGRLELLNTSYFDKQSYTLVILVGNNKLDVSCSCGLKVEMLCRHAYKALSSIVWIYSRSTYFRQYRPNGLIEIATTQKKYFTIKQSDKGLDVSPKPELGSVYQLNEEKPLQSLNAILKLPVPAALQARKQKDIALTYIIMNPHKNRLLPFLLPCMARLNKAGTAVKGFDNFISGTQKQYASLLINEQRTLNDLCYDMWRLVEKLPGHLKGEGAVEAETVKIKEVFNLWQMAIQTLKQQQFVFTYYLYGKKELKGRPARQRVDESVISNEVPVLYFQLADKGAFYQLHLRVLLKGKEISKFDSDITFFVRTNTSLYLLSSLKDAAIVEWMREAGGCITVFKEYFPEFESEFLKPLRESYAVNFIKYRNRP